MLKAGGRGYPLHSTRRLCAISDGTNPRNGVFLLRVKYTQMVLEHRDPEIDEILKSKASDPANQEDEG